MGYRGRVRLSRSALVGALLIFSLALGPQAGLLCRAQTAGPPRLPAPASAPGDIKQSGKPDEAKDEGKGGEKKLSVTAQEKAQKARSTVESILASAHRLVSTEYSILVQVEAATLLWGLDRERAQAALSNAFDSLRRLQEAKTEVSAQDTSSAQRERVEKERLRAAIFRKIARISPDLIREISDRSPAGDRDRPQVFADWTEEARAILVVAYEQLDQDPALAARLARESLSFGVAGIPDFLIRLGRRDRKLAEEQAMVHLGRLRNSSISPFFLMNFRRFIFSGSGGSPQLREYFFESLVIRLKRDIRPDLPFDKFEGLIPAARTAVQISRGYPAWQVEFEKVASEYEALLAARSLRDPGNAHVRSVDISNSVAAEGETKEVAEAASRAGNIGDSMARDGEYKRLAVEASLKANLVLAESLLSKIEDEDLRRKATTSVYGPLVRKAWAEENWAQAKNYAFKITDPLGRSLVVDATAMNMLRVSGDKQAVKELYEAAMSQLQKDRPTQNVAISFFMLASSLLPINQEMGFSAFGWAVHVLNKTMETRPFSWESDSGGELETWVRMPTVMLKPAEALEVTEIIGPLFKEIGLRNPDEAQALALRFSNRGLSLLAQLGVVRAALENSAKSRSATKGGSSL